MATKKLTEEELQKQCKDQEKEISDLKKNTVTKGDHSKALDEIKSLKEEKAKLIEKGKEDTNKIVELTEKLEAPVEVPPTCFVVPAYLPAVELISKSIKEQYRGVASMVVIEPEKESFSSFIDKVLKTDEIPEEFVLISSPCVAINKFSIEDLKTLKVGNGGSYNTGLPVVLEKSKINSDESALSDFFQSYFETHFEDEVPYILSLEKDNMRCGVWRENPNMHIVEKAIETKKFYCFNDSGLKALLPVLEEIYS